MIRLSDFMIVIYNTEQYDKAKQKNGKYIRIEITDSIGEKLCEFLKKEKIDINKIDKNNLN